MQIGRLYSLSTTILSLKTGLQDLKRPSARLSALRLKKNLREIGGLDIH